MEFPIRVALLCLLAGVFFGTHTYLTKISGMSWWVAGLVIHGISFLVFVVVTAFLAITNGGATSAAFYLRPEALVKATDLRSLVTTGLFVLTLAGLANGVGHTFMQPTLASPLPNFTRVSIIVPVMATAVSVGLALLVMKEVLTLNKAGAIAAAALTIYLASRP